MMAPVAEKDLDAAWLRERCRRVFSTCLDREETEEKGLVPAAVLMPVIARPTGLTMLLTRRTPHLRDHAGQISFPGGRCEAQDVSATATALREASEEVGLDPERIEVLAQLPRHLTSTGFSVTPVLGLATPPLDLKPDVFEVAEVFEAPLSFLLDAAHYREEEIVVAGKPRRYWVIPWNGYTIWGATAGMLVALRRFLLAEDA